MLEPSSHEGTIEDRNWSAMLESVAGGRRAYEETFEMFGGEFKQLVYTTGVFVVKAFNHLWKKRIGLERRSKMVVAKSLDGFPNNASRKIDFRGWVLVDFILVMLGRMPRVGSKRWTNESQRFGSSVGFFGVLAILQGASMFIHKFGDDDSASLENLGANPPRTATAVVGFLLFVDIQGVEAGSHH